MKTPTKIVGALVAGLLVVSVLSACSQPSAAQQERQELQQQSREDSLELKNLKEKVSRENDPTAIRYVYLINYSVIFGYYTTEGKISSSSSQIAPEQDLIIGWDTPGTNGEDLYVVDSAKDDGSYGPGDPGIFFFTTEGVMVETSLDYIISDSPLPIDVPRLNQ